jgi:hypothetical protein
MEHSTIDSTDVRKTLSDLLLHLINMTFVPHDRRPHSLATSSTKTLPFIASATTLAGLQGGSATTESSGPHGKPSLATPPCPYLRTGQHSILLTALTVKPFQDLGVMNELPKRSKNMDWVDGLNHRCR